MQELRTRVAIFCLAPAVLLSIVFSLPAAASAPRSAREKGTTPLDRAALHELPPVDVPALLREEAPPRSEGVPHRVGFPMGTHLSPTGSGSWEDLPEGGQLWRLRVRTAGALWTVLGFESFRLLPGATLHVYDPAGSRVLGPFTSADVREHGQLWLPPVAGDTLVVELYWPETLRGREPDLLLGTVSHGYRAWGGIGGETGKDDQGARSGPCNIDVQCPLGDDWQDEKRGVVNLLFFGSGFCSGSLIANSEEDCKNYVLTARHCLSTSGTAASTTFQFNFERPDCGFGVAPTDQVLTGSFLRATAPSGGSDFTLLEMDDPIPDSFNPYYNGWSRSTAAATESWCIHHPANDEKAISFNDDPLLNDFACGGPNHWRVNDWEQGTTEPGSSGSPLFDQNHRIVGQLHCGTASCSSITYDAFGKLDESWNGGGSSSSRLRDWLDPENTGAVTQDGVDWTFCQIPQPELLYTSFLVDDAAGNGNGILEPGESVRLFVNVTNDGSVAATGVSGVASTSSPMASFPEPVTGWPDVPAQQTRTSSLPGFGLQLAADFSCGAPVEVQMDLNAVEFPGAWNAAFDVPTGDPLSAQTYGDDMESGINGWTVNPPGIWGWNQVTTDSQSPTHSWFIIDLAKPIDARLFMPTQVNLPANARLRFLHRFDTQDARDGGVLEYSTDGSSWQDAGSLVIEGSYSATILSGTGSALAGRPAWTGSSGGWQTVVVDLSSLAGSDLQIRWRFASDTSTAGEGWWVDDVAVEVITWDCAPVPPGEVSSPLDPSPPLTVERDPGGYALAWAAPSTGGDLQGYRLYGSTLQPGGPWIPSCEADLGSGTSIVLADLTGDRGYVVVAVGSAGEGSYGRSSSGVERTRAEGVQLCP